MICPKCRKDYSAYEQWCPRCGHRNYHLKERDTAQFKNSDPENNLSKNKKEK